MTGKITTVQRNFSGGQIDARARRADDLDLVRNACRTMKNCRSTSLNTAKRRPGRRAHYDTEAPRAEYVRITPSKVFRFLFSYQKIKITDDNDTFVAQNTSTSYLWTADTIGQLSFTLADTDVVICFPGMRPQVASYDKENDSWSFGAFTFATRAGKVQAPFVRIGIPGETLTPSAKTGSITLTSSADYFTASMVGRVLSILGRQVTITAVGGLTSATATIATQLSDWVEITATKTGPFQVGDIAETITSKVKIEVGSVDSGTSKVRGTLMSSLELYAASISATDQLVSEDGNSEISLIANYATALPTVQWAEEFMSDDRGWPAKCFFTNNRLGFCDFPQQPNAILMSAVGAYSSFWVDPGASSYTQSAGASASSAILEYAPNNARVRHVVDFGDLIVFTDNGTYSVPVSTSNPLKPGSMEFRPINSDAVSDVRPVVGQDAVLYTNAGGNRISSIIAVGQASRSYTSQDISDAYSGIVNNPVALVLATGDDSYPERMVYAVNADGTVIAGRFISVGETFGVGWYPYESEYPVRWVLLALNEVHFIVQYGNYYVAEVEDDDEYLDSAMFYNVIPNGMVKLSPPGPCWWLAGGTVTLMEGGRDLGERAVDGDGYIIQEPDDDLTSLTLKVGTRAVIEVEPFVPNIQAGEARGQRMTERKISNAAVHLDVSNGAQIGRRLVPAYEAGEDADADPPLRQTCYNVGAIGAAYDPRFSIIKDRPGDFELLEITLEVSI